MNPGIEIRKVQPGLVWVIHQPHWVRPIHVEELAMLLDVTRQTIGRWCRGHPIPRTVQLALKHVVLGFLAGDRWQGWRVDEDGTLWAPNEYGFCPAELEHWQLVFATNRALWRRLQEHEPELEVPPMADPRAPRMTRAARRSRQASVM